jgi:hypothetical protein
MRTLTIWALALFGVTAVGGVSDVLTNQSVAGFSTNIGWTALLFLVASCGLILALIASVRGMVRAGKRHEWGWLAALIVGLLLPMPVSFSVADAIQQYASATVVGFSVDTYLPEYLPIFVGLLLTPVTALVYVVRHEGDR